MTLDLRSLGLFRIALGTAILVDLIDRLRSFSLFTQDAPAPAVAAFFALHALVALAFTVGLRTRLMTAAALALAIVLHASAPLVLYAGDGLERALLVWALFLPVGARFSVDARFDRAPGTHRSIASFALVLQLVLLFGAAGVEKLLHSSAWRGGSALEILLHDDIYVMPLGAALANAVGPDALRVLTWLALACEVGAPLALFARRWRVRLFGAAALAYMMICIWLVLGVGLFPVVSIAGLLALVPAEAWRTRPPPLPTPLTRTRADALAVAGALVMAATSALNAAGISTSPWTPQLVNATGLAQHWGMFWSPEGLPRGWFHVVGTGTDGALVDVFTGAPARDNVEPPPFATLVPFRERRVWEATLVETNAALLPSIGRWACARSPVPVTSLTAYYVRPPSEGPPEGSTVAVIALFRVECP